jgi:hypothetical protein
MKEQLRCGTFGRCIAAVFGGAGQTVGMLVELAAGISTERAQEMQKGRFQGFKVSRFGRCGELGLGFFLLIGFGDHWSGDSHGLAAALRPDRV